MQFGHLKLVCIDRNIELLIVAKLAQRAQSCDLPRHAQRRIK